MSLTLEQVRTAPFDSLPGVPAGFKIVGELKAKKNLDPRPYPYSWYTRWNSTKHEIFQKLYATETGLTVEELKASYTDPADQADVDIVVDDFKKNSNRHRSCGQDLVVDETGTKYRIIYRDPTGAYADEIGFTGDRTACKSVAIPDYVTKVPAMIEEAKKPKPEKAAKEPKAAKSKAAATPTAPPGGYLNAFNNVPVAEMSESNRAMLTKVGVTGDNLRAVLLDAIDKYVDANAAHDASTDKGGLEPATGEVNDKARLIEIIDKFGMAKSTTNPFVDYVAHWQRDNHIRTGFYAISKALNLEYEAFLKRMAAATPAVAQPAAPATA